MPVPANPADRSPDLAREIEALHGSSYGWALACCGRDRDEACEVLQQAYCRVLSGQARFAGRSSLRTWLFGVIRLCARERRRWWRLDRLLRSASEAPDQAPSPEEGLAARRESAALSRALAGLAARQREVLHLVFYEDLSISEAAEILGVSVGTARQHYHRGKQNIAAALTAAGAVP